MVESLHERREKLVGLFAKKNLVSERFGDWFVERKHPAYERRSINYAKYVEPCARTDRLRNLPLNYMRRKLSNL